MGMMEDYLIELAKSKAPGVISDTYSVLNSAEDSALEQKINHLKQRTQEKIARLSDKYPGMGEGVSKIADKTYMNNNKLYNAENANTAQEVLGAFAANKQWQKDAKGQFFTVDEAGNKIIQDPTQAGVLYSGVTPTGDTKLGYVKAKYGEPTADKEVIADYTKHNTVGTNADLTQDPNLMALYGNINDIKELEAFYHGRQEALNNRKWDLGSKDPNRPESRYTEIYKGPDATSWLGAYDDTIKTNQDVVDIVKNATSEIEKSQIPLGAISKKYESGGKVSTIAPDTGGTTSYGIYQLNSAGTMQNFLSSPEGAIFGQELAKYKIGSKDFNAAYKKLAETHGEQLAAAQDKYIEKTHYTPLLEKAKSLGLNTEDPRVKEALWSQSVQHSPDGNTTILKNAINNLGAEATTDDLIKALYDSRLTYVNSLSNLDKNTKKNLAARYQKEYTDVTNIPTDNLLEAIKASDGYFGELIDTAQGAIASLGADAINALQKIIGKENTEKYNNFASSVEKMFGGDGDIGIFINKDGDIKGTDVNIKDFRNREFAAREFGVSLETIDKHNAAMAHGLKNWTEADTVTDHITSMAGIVSELPMVLAQSAGEIAALAIPGGSGVVAGIRTSNYAEEYEKNNGKEMPLEKLAQTFFTELALLIPEKLLIKSGVKDVLSKLPTKTKTGRIALGAAGEGAQEWGEGISEEVATQKEGEKTLGEIAMAPEQTFGAAVGAMMGGGLSTAGVATDVLKKGVAGIQEKIPTNNDKEAPKPKDIKKEYDAFINSLSDEAVTREQLIKINSLAQAAKNSGDEVLFKDINELKIDIDGLYNDQIKAGLQEDKIELKSRKDLEFLLDDIAVVENGEIKFKSEGMDEKLFELASRKGILGTESIEKQKEVYNSIKKDFATVEIEATTGKRGYLTYAKELDVLLENPLKDPVKLMKKVEELQKFENSQEKYLKGFNTAIETLQNDILKYNNHLKASDILSNKEIPVDIKTILKGAKEGENGYQVEKLITDKSTFKFNIIKNTDGTLSLPMTDNIKAIIEAKKRNIAGIKNTLTERATQLENSGVSPLITGVSTKNIVDTNDVKYKNILNSTAEDIKKQETKAKEQGGVVKYITLQNEGGYTEALTKNVSELVNTTKYNTNDIVYITLDKPKTVNELKEIKKSLLTGGVLNKEITAAKKAGATIVLDKSLYYKQNEDTVTIPGAEIKGKIPQLTVVDLLKNAMNYKLPKESTEVSLEALGTYDNLRAEYLTEDTDSNLKKIFSTVISYAERLGHDLKTVRALFDEYLKDVNAPIKTVKEFTTELQRLDPKESVDTRYKPIRTSEGTTDTRRVFKPAEVVKKNRTAKKEVFKAKIKKDKDINAFYTQWITDKQLDETQKNELFELLDNKKNLPKEELIQTFLDGRKAARINAGVQILKENNVVDINDLDIKTASKLESYKNEWEDIKVEYTNTKKVRNKTETLMEKIKELKQEFLNKEDIDDLDFNTEVEILYNGFSRDTTIVQDIFSNSASKDSMDLYVNSKGEVRSSPEKGFNRHVQDITKYLKEIKIPNVLSMVALKDIFEEKYYNSFTKNMSFFNNLKLAPTKPLKTKVGTDTKYTERDLQLKDSPALGLLFDKEGKINENVAFAILLSGMEYIAFNSSMLNPEFKSKKDMARMLGVIESQISKELFHELQNKGMFNKTMANEIGKIGLQKLGVQFNKETAKDVVEKEVFDRLEADFGNLAIILMEDLNWIKTDTTLTASKFAELKGEKLSEYTKTDKDQATIRMVTLAQPTAEERAKRIETVANAYKEVHEILGDDAVFEKKYYLAEDGIPHPRHEQEQVSKDIVGIKIPTGTKESKGAKEFLEKLVKIEWKVDKNSVDSFLDAYETEASKNVLLSYLGYVHKEDLDKMTVKGRIAAESQNRDILKSIEELQKMKNNEDYNQALLFDWFYTSNGRYMIDSNTVNPQTDKLHRFFIQPEKHFATYKVENGVVTYNGKDVTSMMNYALAQAFGFKVDKKETAKINMFGEALKKLTKKQLDQLESEFYLGKSLEKDENGKTIPWILPGKSGLEIGVDHVSHVIQAIQVLRDMKQGEFSTALTAEFDAITNGFALKLLQFPILNNVWEWLNKVGIFRKSDIEKYTGKLGALSMNDILDGHMRDSYQTLSVNVKLDGVINKLGFVEKNIWSHLEKGNLLQKFDEKSGEVSKALRDLFKNPFMTFNYSAGISSIKKSLAENLTSEILENIAQENPAYKDLAKALEDVFEIKLVDKLRNTPADKITVKIGDRKINLEKMLEDMFVKTYGEEVEHIMTNSFGEFMRANDTINGAFKVMFDIFKTEYDARKVKIPVGKFDEEAFLTIMYGEMLKDGNRNVKNGLLQKFPLIKGPLSADGDIQEGIAIYSQGSITPTGNDVRYTPVNTHTGSDVKSQKTRTVHHIIKDFEAAISAGSVVPIHYIDGAVMAQLADYDITAIHDAILPPLFEAENVIKEFNKSVLDINSKYRLISAIKEMLDRVSTEDKANSKSPIRVWKQIKGEWVSFYTNTENKKNSEFNNISNNVVFEEINTLNKTVEKAWNKIKDQIDVVMHMVGTEDTNFVKDGVDLSNVNLKTTDKKSSKPQTKVKTLGSGLLLGETWDERDISINQADLDALKKENKELINKTKVKIEWVEKEDSTGFEYNKNTNTVTLVKGMDEVVETVLTNHELKHALTAEYIINNSHTLGMKELLKAVEKFTDKMKKIPLSEMTAEQGVLLQRLQYMIKPQEVEGFTLEQRHIAEIVAILSAEKDIREAFLNQFKDSERSQIQKLIDWIRSKLSFTPVTIELSAKDVVNKVDSIIEKVSVDPQTDKVIMSVKEIKKWAKKMAKECL